MTTLSCHGCLIVLGLRHSRPSRRRRSLTSWLLRWWFGDRRWIVWRARRVDVTNLTWFTLTYRQQTWLLPSPYSLTKFFRIHAIKSCSSSVPLSISLRESVCAVERGSTVVVRFSFGGEPGRLLIDLSITMINKLRDESDLLWLDFGVFEILEVFAFDGEGL